MIDVKSLTDHQRTAALQSLWDANDFIRLRGSTRGIEEAILERQDVLYFMRHPEKLEEAMTALQKERTDLALKSSKIEEEIRLLWESRVPKETE